MSDNEVLSLGTLTSDSEASQTSYDVVGSLHRSETLDSLALLAQDGEVIDLPVDEEDWYRVGLDDQAIYELTRPSDAPSVPSATVQPTSEGEEEAACEEDTGEIDRILARRGRGEAALYLVKWCGVEEPTWETEEDLEDGGWEDWVLKYNSQPKKRQPTAVELVEKDYRRAIALVEAHCFAELKYRFLTRNNELVTRYSLYPRGNAYFNADTYWPCHKQRIAKALHKSGLKATHIQYIVKPSLARLWTQLWAKSIFLPVMMVHRPSTGEVPRLLEKGLEHPRFNGKTYPLYVEMLTDSLSADSYSGYVMVGAYLIGNTQKINTRVSNFLLVDNAKRILPCYLVKVEPAEEGSAVTMPVDHPLFDPLAPWPPAANAEVRDTGTLEEELERMASMLMKKANQRQARCAVARRSLHRDAEEELLDKHAPGRQRIFDITNKNATKSELRKAKNTQKGDFRKQLKTGAKTRG